MEILWQLFKPQIIAVSLVLLILIAWLVWPRKHKKTRRRLLMLNGLVILTSIVTSLHTYWPREYDKTYLNDEVSTLIKSTSLKTLADSIPFYIGVATSPNSEYEELISTEFNSLVAENHFKPGSLLKDANNWEFDFSDADRIVQFAQKNDMRLRGHTLIWGKYPGMTHPVEWIDQVKKSADPEIEMKAIISQYIKIVMGHFKGKVVSWDVVNEPMGSKGLYSCIFTEAMGEEYIEYAFREAHKVDPDCALYLNEQIVNYSSTQAKEFLNLLTRLVAKEVPIHGVGLQSHHINHIHDLDGMKKYIRSIAELGLDVEITELDMRLLLFGNENDPYNAQGDQYKNVVQICIADPACKGVTLWGLTDKSNWMDAIPPFKWKSPNSPNIFDEEMKRKPAYIGIWKALNGQSQQ